MRCRISEEGRSHKTWQYILEFSEAFEEKRFVDKFNEAVTRIDRYERFLLDFQDSHCYLLDDSGKIERRCAEFDFTKYDDNPRKVIVCVKRLEMTRESLHDFLETLIGNTLNQVQPESQPCPSEQLSLFRLEK